MSQAEPLDSQNKAPRKMVLTTSILMFQCGIFILLALGLAFFLSDGTVLRQLYAGLALKPWSFVLGLLMFFPMLLLDEVAGFLNRKFKLGMADDQAKIEIPDLSTPMNIVRAFSASFSEEILLRGVVQALCGIWVASSIFGLMHVLSLKGLIRGVYTTLRGLCYGAMYIYTGSLWVPIMVHALKDFVAFDLRSKKSVIRKVLRLPQKAAAENLAARVPPGTAR